MIQLTISDYKCIHTTLKRQSSWFLCEFTDITYPCYKPFKRLSFKVALQCIYNLKLDRLNKNSSLC